MQQVGTGGGDLEAGEPIASAPPGPEAALPLSRGALRYPRRPIAPCYCSRRSPHSALPKVSRWCAASTPERFWPKLETLGELAGLGLIRSSLIGHRYTADSDIFEAIGLKRARTMLSFDPRRAGAPRELPWVEQASIERVFPDRLEVRITERTPLAVWSRGERSF